jgi:hypothetical protein
MLDPKTIPQASQATTASATEPQARDDNVASDTPVSHDSNTSNPVSARTAALLKKKAMVEQKLAELEAELASQVANAKLPSGLEMPSSWTTEQKTSHVIDGANATVKDHIELLHRYNAIKDIGLGLLGLVAEQRGVRQAVVMEEFGLSAKD